MLEVSKPFTTDAPPWELLNSTGNPNLYQHGVTSGGDDLMILLGGVSDSASSYAQTSNLWYCHTDNSSKVFQQSSINANYVQNLKRYLASVTLVTSDTPDTDDIVVIGGRDYVDYTLPKVVLTIGTSSIETGNAAAGINDGISDESISRYDHTATLLDGKIYIIGGRNNAGLMDMTSVGVYDTKASKWSLIVSYLFIYYICC